MNSGQACAAPTRMLVPQHLHDEVVRLAKASAEGTTVGDPLKDGIKVGPLVSRAQFDRVQGYITKGIEEGATLVAGGPGRARGPRDRPLRQAHDLCECPQRHERSRRKRSSVRCWSSSRTRMRTTRSASPTTRSMAFRVSWSRRISSAPARSRRRLRTGQVRLNGAKHDFSAPFGGYKFSGNGREFGVFGIEEYLEAKSICGYFAA